MHKRLDGNKFGFTIVELIVVIVVIGILAAFTIVSYTGIANKATVATLQSDLVGGSKTLKIYQLSNGNNNEDYPTDLDCNTSPADNTVCLKASAGNSFTFYISNNTTNPKTFILEATSNNGMKYRITEDMIPTAVAVDNPVTDIDVISGTTTSVGSVLTAGALTPSEATVLYQWQSSVTPSGTYTNISGATSDTYTLTVSDVGKYLKVTATGFGLYSGSQTSTASTIVSDVNWLAIGSQVWAKYNLNVGTMVTGATAQTDNAIVEKYCHSNTASNCTTYGGLYQWNEAMQYVTTEGAQGICPVNSHIPSDNDWKILEIQLGMTQVQADSTGLRGTNQGTQLKSGGSSGLNIPLAGHRDSGSTFYNLSSTAFLWSSSREGVHPFERYLSSAYSTVGRDLYGEGNGFSVRCVGN